MRSKNDWLDYLEHSVLCHYGVVGMHWGVRRYQPYSTVPRKSGKGGKELGAAKKTATDQQKHARRIYKKASKIEPIITKKVQKAFKKAGAESYGLDHRLKTEESILRKTTDTDKKINDAVRYTAILDDKNFVKQYKTIKQSLERSGWVETKCKNYFEDYKSGKVNHKSVQTNYQTPLGYTFEIQFQTKASQKAKDKKTPLYEEARNPKTSTARKSELVKEMRKLADTVDDPPGIEQIKSHKHASATATAWRLTLLNGVTQAIGASNAPDIWV